MAVPIKGGGVDLESIPRLAVAIVVVLVGIDINALDRVGDFSFSALLLAILVRFENGRCGQADARQHGGGGRGYTAQGPTLHTEVDTILHNRLQHQQLDVDETDSSSREVSKTSLAKS